MLCTRVDCCVFLSAGDKSKALQDFLVLALIHKSSETCETQVDSRSHRCKKYAHAHIDR